MPIHRNISDVAVMSIAFLKKVLRFICTIMPFQLMYSYINYMAVEHPFMP